MNGSEKGLSLIEVLVSLVILVIGLIGVFNLHIISKQGSFESYQQTQASYLAHDIINRMKVNNTILDAYSGTYDGSLSAPGKICRDPAALCDANELKDYDLYFWEQALIGNNELKGTHGLGGLDTPQACVSVTDEGAPFDGRQLKHVEVVIRWKGIRKLTTGNDDSGSPQTPECGSDDHRRKLTVSNKIVSG